MGKALTVNFYQKLIFYKDLRPLENEINSVNNQYNKFLTNLRNITNILQDTELHNYQKMLEFSISELNYQFSTLIPRERNKRGLVDGLGSIFKALSGNLDAADGQRYDKLITTIQTNQKTLENHINNQITISQKLIDKFNTTLTSISHNEHSLRDKIDRLVYLEKSSENYDHIKFLFNYLLNVIINLKFVILNLENAITFSKLRTLHQSIIDTKDLLEELKSLDNNLELPFKPDMNNILEFENIITTKAYIYNSKLTFILEIPIINKIKFDIYHLFSIPKQINGTYMTIVPRKKYLLKSQNSYIFDDQLKCKKSNNNYICDYTKEDETESNQKTCEPRIIDFNDPTKCLFTPILFNKTIIQRVVDSNYWIIIPKNSTTVTELCEEQTTATLLLTPTLIKTSGCALKFDNKVIHAKDIEGVRKLPIMIAYGTPTKVLGSNYTITTPDLEEINLDDLRKIESRLQTNRVNLVQQEIHNHPVWTFVLYIILIIFVCCYLWKKFHQHFPKKNKKYPSTTNLGPVDPKFPI